LETVAANLPAALCLFVVAAVVVAAVVTWRRRRGPDTGGWALADGVVVSREEIHRRDVLWLRLVVKFRTWQGQPVRFTDEGPAWQMPHQDVVPVIFDPASPQRARVVRRHRP